MRALIASGAGRYSDPWHDLARTSAALQRILVEAGFETRVVHDLDAALAALEEVDLLVVNATDPWRNGETGKGASPAGTAGLEAAVERGIGVLCVHNAISSLRDYPLWRRLVGGDWIPGVSGHPPRGLLEVRMTRTVPGVPAAFTLLDEGYTFLEVDPDVQIAAEHLLDGRSHPLFWTRTAGRTRVVYDALGHDAASYRSPAHVALLSRAVEWAAAPSSGASPASGSW